MSYSYYSYAQAPVYDPYTNSYMSTTAAAPLSYDYTNYNYSNPAINYSNYYFQPQINQITNSVQQINIKADEPVEIKSTAYEKSTSTSFFLK